MQLFMVLNLAAFLEPKTTTRGPCLKRIALAEPTIYVFQLLNFECLDGGVILWRAITWNLYHLAQRDCGPFSMSGRTPYLVPP